MMKQLEHKSSSCPCGSGTAYTHCCQPIHLGKLPATPEILMRSRYSAYVLQLRDFLLGSWHSSTRPAGLDFEAAPQWTRLEILGSKDSFVRFRASYARGEGWGYLEEESEFVKEQGRWSYLKGVTREGVLKPERNRPCPCGSGRKFKHCCN